MTRELTFGPDGKWEVHRREGAKRVAIRHPHWQKPMYLTAEVARDLMDDIAKCLGVPGPDVNVRPRCTDENTFEGIVLRCQSDADAHPYGRHYWTNGNTKISWRKDR